MSITSQSIASIAACSLIRATIQLDLVQKGLRLQIDLRVQSKPYPRNVFTPSEILARLFSACMPETYQRHEFRPQVTRR